MGVLDRYEASKGTKHRIRYYPAAGAESPVSGGSGSRPLVVFIGWLGSTDRLVSKYAHGVYASQLHLPCVSFIPSFQEMVLHSRDTARRAAVQLLDLVERALEEGEQTGELNGLVWSAASNNGGVFTSVVLQVLREPNSRSKYVHVRRHWKALISESFPGSRTDDRRMGQVLAGFDDPRPGKGTGRNARMSWPSYIVACVSWVVIYALVISGYFGSMFSEDSMFLKNLTQIDTILDTDKAVSALVLYSRQDWLVPEEDVEKFWSGQWSKGRESKARMVHFDDDNIEHLRILPVQPDAYVRSIKQFLVDNDIIKQ